MMAQAIKLDERHHYISYQVGYNLCYQSLLTQLISALRCAKNLKFVYLTEILILYGLNRAVTEGQGPAFMHELQ